jgi:hypothetical protein
MPANNADFHGVNFGLIQINNKGAKSVGGELPPRIVSEFYKN